MLKENYHDPNDAGEISPRVSEFKRFCKVFFSRKLVIFGSIVILGLVFVAIFAPILAPFDPYYQNLDQPLVGPGREHLLGTDTLGRDLLSRIIYGSRISLMIGVVIVFSSSLVGLTLGLIAGYFGGATHALIMRFIDALMSLPMIMLALVIASVLGGGLNNVMVALGIGLLPGYARLMCAQVLTIK
jgi:peptide/nickel transport system permease protein